MSLPPAPNLVRCAIVHQLHGQEVVNVINVRFPGDATTILIQNLAVVIRDAWVTHIMPLLSYQLTLERIELRQAVPGSGLAFDYAVSPIVPGGSVVDADQTMNAVVISLRTGQAGRSYRGRLFIGGIDNGIVQNGVVNAGFRGALADALGEVVSEIQGGSTGTVVIASFFSAGLQRLAVVMTPVISIVSVTSYPAVQRRRRVSVGD